MAKQLSFDTREAAEQHLTGLGAEGPLTTVRIALDGGGIPVPVYPGNDPFSRADRIGTLERNDWGGLTFTPEERR
jgi:hypothetical protein